jgi:hypothetical protein
LLVAETDHHKGTRVHQPPPSVLCSFGDSYLGRFKSGRVRCPPLAITKIY